MTYNYKLFIHGRAAWDLDTFISSVKDIIAEYFPEWPKNLSPEAEELLRDVFGYPIKHSGYTLVKYETDSEGKEIVVGFSYVDLAGGKRVIEKDDVNFENLGFVSGIPSEIFTNNSYSLLNISNPLEVFDRMTLDAALRSSSTHGGPMNFEYIDKMCNTWSNYMAMKFMGMSSGSVFDGLPGTYLTSGFNYVEGWVTGWNDPIDQKKAYAIDAFHNFIVSNNIDVPTRDVRGWKDYIVWNSSCGLEITLEGKNYIFYSNKDNVSEGNWPIKNKETNKIILLFDGNDRLENSGSNVKIFGGFGEDKIFNTAKDVEIHGDDDISIGTEGFDDEITNSGDNVKITGGLGSDKIINTGNDVRIYADFENKKAGPLQHFTDTITNTGNDVYIYGGMGTSKITSEGNNVYIYGASDGEGGVDEITVSGTGYHYIDTYGGDDKINISGSGRVTAYGGKGVDTITVTGSGEYRLNGEAGDDIYKINTKDATINIYDKDGTNKFDFSSLSGLIGGKLGDGKFYMLDKTGGSRIVAEIDGTGAISAAGGSATLNNAASGLFNARVMNNGTISGGTAIGNDMGNITITGGAPTLYSIKDLNQVYLPNCHDEASDIIRRVSASGNYAKYYSPTTGYLFTIYEYDGTIPNPTIITEPKEEEEPPAPLPPLEGDETDGRAKGRNYYGGPEGPFNDGEDKTIVRQDPLVVDLDGDGIEIKAADGKAMFDLTGSGFKTNNDWLSGDDAFLAVDKNGNGKIDDISELFGSPTKTGFEELKEYDSNKDGVIDENDVDFDKIKLWQDANGDAVTDEGELKSLKDMGIKSISLDKNKVNIIKENSLVIETGTFTKDDGTEGQVGEVLFFTDTVNSEFSPNPSNPNQITLNPEVLGLPYMKGFGTLLNFHLAASSDDVFKAMLQELKTVTIDQMAGYREKIEALIYRWTKTEDVAMSGDVPLRNLKALEQYMGRGYNQNGTNTPSGEAVALVNEAWDVLVGMVMRNSVAQTILKGIGIDCAYDLTSNKIVFGESAVQIKDKIVFAVNAAKTAGKMGTLDVIGALSSMFPALSGSNVSMYGIASALGMEDYLGFIVNPNEAIKYAKEGGSYLSGDYYEDATDILIGKGGNDNLYGYKGNDILDGGTGNDYLSGGEGDDAYRFGLGYGNDRIYDQSGNDTIEMLSSVKLSEIKITRELGNIKITLKDGSTLTIEGGAGGDYIIEKIRFLNGTDGVLDLKEYIKTLPMEGTAGNDYMSSSNEDNSYLLGFNSGHDTIYDYKGSDVITFKVDVGMADITFKRVLNDLVIALGDRTSYTLRYFNDGPDYQVEKIRFLNGIDPEINLFDHVRNLPIYGTDGNDSIYGKDGQDDILDGGKGDDYLSGSGGNDVYRFGLGDGHDKIYEGGGNDTIEFKEGIAFEDLTFERINGDVVITLSDGSSLTLQNAGGRYESYRIEKLKFADGTITDLMPVVEGLTIKGTTGNDSIYGRDDLNDTISGGKGDDTIYGGLLDDTYIFGLGDGHDRISDNGGSDTILFKEGITLDDITVSRLGDDVIITLKDGSSLTVSGGGGNSSNYHVETLKFHNGSQIPFMDMVNDVTIGGNDGNNTIYGRDGIDDVLDGGAGDDTLRGGSGNDTYIFGFGYGHDKISESDGLDAILFKEGITKDNIVVSRVRDDVIITLADGSTLTVQGGGGSSASYWVEKLKFHDGNELDLMEIVNRTVIGGTSGNDYLYGKDTLDDILDGGAGNDTLRGGKGNDTYIFGLGYGHDEISESDGLDVILFKEGITKENLAISRVKDDVVITLADGSTLTVKSGGGSSASYWIEKLKFADGAELDLMEIVNRTVIGGTSGNDYLYGKDTLDDILDGGVGNDTLQGGKGNDTYRFGFGYGSDSIYETAGSDTIELSADVRASDLTFSRFMNDVIITLTDGSTFTIKDACSSDARMVEKIKFLNGIDPEIDLVERIENTPIYGSDADDNFKGRSNAKDIFFGGRGNDTISGNSGNDELHGEDGDDKIYGGDGNDILFGGAGDDKLYGDAGNDILDGGAGNDVLEGGTGDDIYRFGFGYGNDVINEVGGNDVIEFLEGIGFSDVLITRILDDVIITLSDGSSLTIKDAGKKGAEAKYVEKLIFSDQEINLVELLKNVTVSGTAGNDVINGKDGVNDIIDGLGGDDTIYGLSGDDTIFGGSGNDKLYGGTGNDILDGGLGDDVLSGGEGDDTYRFGFGQGGDVIEEHQSVNQGFDTIEFASDVRLSDLTVTREMYNIRIMLSDGSSFLIKNGGGSSNGFIERLKFLNGIDGDIDFAEYLKTVPYAGTDGNDTIKGMDATDDILNGGKGNDKLYGGGGNDILNGQEGDDVLYGGDGNDILDGGVGNDTLEGGSGDDTYRFGLGYGNDTIIEASGNDVIELLDGVNFAETRIIREINDIKIILKDGSVLVVKDAALNEGKNVETIRFLNGTDADFNLVEFLKSTAILGTSGNDHLNGTDSVSDIIYGGDGNDTIYGYGGHDYLFGEGGNDIIYGGIGNDTLVGEAGDDTLRGEAGNDLLDGGAGNDLLYGGEGNDIYRFGFGYGTDTIEEYQHGNEGTDTIEFNEDVSFNDLTITRELHNIRITLTDGSSILIKNQYGYSSTGYIEKLRFLNGVDAEIDFYEYMKGIPINGTDGNDTINAYGTNDTISGGLGNDSLNGKAGNDRVYGSAGDDNLWGEAGNDYLDGGTGNDVLKGGDGNDIYRFGFGYGNDTIEEYQHGNEGTDTIEFAEDVSFSDLTITRELHNIRITLTDGSSILIKNQYGYSATGYIEKLRFLNGIDGEIDFAGIVEGIPYIGTDSGDTLKGTNGANDVLYGLKGNDTLYGYSGNDKLYGDEGDDSLYGGAGNDTLKGGLGDDTLRGEAGNDILDGGIGNDKLYGGEGNDIYRFGFEYGTDTIEEYQHGNEGTDTIEFADNVRFSDLTITRDLHDIVITLSDGSSLRIKNQYSSSSTGFIEKLKFLNGIDGEIDFAGVMEGIPYIGTDNGDTLKGTNGAKDVLYGFKGNDTLYGYSGNDKLYGGEGDDTLYGGAGNDTLEGGIGDDTLRGEDGNDYLDGGTGNDKLYGGEGNDTYRFGFGYGNDIIEEYKYGNQGNDTIEFATDVRLSDLTITREMYNIRITLTDGSSLLLVEGSYYKPSYIEKLRFLNGIDGEIDFNEYMKSVPFMGTAGNDSIGGFDGVDDTIKAGAGNDSLRGHSGNDKLYGEDGDDALEGGTGNDYLDGGTGNDVLKGGEGNDTYRFGFGYGNDTIEEYRYGNQGNDTIEFAADVRFSDLTITREIYNIRITLADGSSLLLVEGSYHKPSYIEKLRFLNGIDGEIDFNEYMKSVPFTGTAGNDSIGGFDGVDDTIKAGAGNDSLRGHSGNDKLYGESGDDTIEGGAGNDYLDGGSGNDILKGGEGNDTYRFGFGYGNDIIEEYRYGNQGNDIIEMAANVRRSDITITNVGDDLKITLSDGSTLTVKYGAATNFQIERIKFLSGDADIYLGPTYGSASVIGDEYNNNLSGSNNVNDHMEGRGGNDTLYGYSGNDSIYGGDGDDTLHGGEGDDILYGNEGNDTIYGDSGNDRLNGWKGTNYLYGGDGDDTYEIGFDYGHDTIMDSSGYDTILFLNPVRASNITITKSGHDVIICLSSGASLTIKDMAGSYWSDRVVERLRFANGIDGDIDLLKMIEKIPSYGTVNAETFYGRYDHNDIFYAAGGNDILRGYTGNDDLHGGDGDDRVEGDAGDDKLYGDAGNDTIYGGAGDDLLDGGTGNDYLEGNDGDDVYRFGYGYGNDTVKDDSGFDVIEFAADVRAQDITVTKSVHDVIITLSDGSSLTIKDMAGSYWNERKVEKLKFLNGVDGDIDLLKLIEKIPSYGTANAETFYGLNDYNDIFYAAGGNDILRGYTGNDDLHGGDGDDHVEGNEGDDKLYGDAGNDTLEGAAGDDYLDGGAGNDLLYGGDGDDVYRFGYGYGNDTVKDDSGFDVIEFAANVKAADITVTKSVHDVIITLSDGSSLTIKDMASSYWNDRKIEKLKFLNGVDGDIDLLKFIEKIPSYGTANAETFYGLYDHNDIFYATGGNDILRGYTGNDDLHGGDGDDRVEGNEGDDKLYGDAGNDTLEGAAGDDYLDGGAGNDLLYGGDGDDVYRFGYGYGNDTVKDDSGFDVIEFAADVRAQDITVTKSNHDVIITLSDGSSLTIKDMAGSYYNDRKIEKLKFTNGIDADIDLLKFIEKIPGYGTVSGETFYGLNDHNDIFYAAGGNDTLNGNTGNDELHGGDGDDRLYGHDGDDKLYGDAGNDTLEGAAGDDYLDGGSGNDLLYAGDGDDVYKFGYGYGNDTLMDSSGFDVIEFAENIRAQDITVTKSMHDVIITLSDGSSLTIKDMTGSYYNDRKIEKLKFLNGVDGDIDFLKLIEKIPSYGTATAETFYGLYDHNDIFYAAGGNDTLNGNTGNDELHGGDGDDRLYGHDGDDKLYGDAGNDTLEGAAGDDYLDGGAGNDTLNGGTGDDTYIFSEGTDIINEASGNDILNMADLDYDKIWVSKTGNDLKISEIGSDNTTTIKNWYSSDGYKIETINAGNMYLDKANVDLLVQAMASFNPPAQGTIKDNATLDNTVSQIWQTRT